MKININLRKILYILMIVSLFKPIGVVEFEIVNTIFKVFKCITIIMIVVVMIIKIISNENYKSIKIKDIQYLLPLIFFWIIYILNSYIHKADYIEIINNAITSILLISFIVLESKNNGDLFFKLLNVVFKVYLIINLLSFAFIYIFNTPLFGTNNTLYFLGMDNYSAFAVIPMITVVLYYDIRENGKFSIFNLVLLAILFLSYLYAKSYTAILACVLYIIGVILIILNKNIFKFINFKSIILLTIIILILILVFNVQDKFAFILNDIIKKGITLNSRTIIWQDAINIIKDNFIIGYGNLSADNVASYYLYGATHTHNFLLELLFTTGIVGTVLFLFFYDKAFTGIYKIKNTKNNILLLGILVYTILSFMDYYVLSQYQYCLIGIMYGIIHIQRSNQCEENK